MDRTYVLPGTDRRFRIVRDDLRVEQSSWRSKGSTKISVKTCKHPTDAVRHVERTVEKKLRDGYAYVAEPAQRGDLILEALGGHAIDLSLDGRRLATATRSEDGEMLAIAVVDVATGARRFVCEQRVPRIGRVTALRFDATGEAVRVAYECLAGDDYGPRIARAELDTGAFRVIAPGTLLGCDAARRRMLVAHGDRLSILEDDLVIYEHAADTTSAAAISPSGRLLAVHFAHRHDILRFDERTRNEVQLWDIDARAPWETVALPKLSRLRAFTVAPGDAELVVAWQEGKGPLGLAIPDGNERWCIDVVGKTWLHAGALLAVAATDRVHVFDAERREIPLPAAIERAHSLACSRDGARLALGSGRVASVYAMAGAAT